MSCILKPNVKHLTKYVKFGETNYMPYFFLSKQLHYFYHLNELYLLNKMSFLSGRTACWGFFFSYSDFFLPSKAGVTDVTAMFVNFNRRSAVTQATTYIKQIVINTLPC